MSTFYTVETLKDTTYIEGDEFKVDGLGVRVLRDGKQIAFFATGPLVSIVDPEFVLSDISTDAEELAEEVDEPGTITMGEYEERLGLGSQSAADTSADDTVLPLAAFRTTGKPN